MLCFAEHFALQLSSQQEKANRQAVVGLELESLDPDAPEIR